MKQLQQTGPAAARGRLERRCRWILFWGIAARLISFVMMTPFNSDDHLGVIDFLTRTGRLATATDLNQGYHPPLYYLLACWPWILFHSAKAVQGLSLVFSVASLIAIDRLLAMRNVLSARWRPWCLALAAFHPEFVLYTLFLSNDSLTILMGSLLMLAMARAQQRSTTGDRGGAAAVAGFLGLGLLTKATFLAYVPPVSLFLLLLDRGRSPFRRRLAWTAGWIAFALLLGSFKYIEDYRLYHNPFTSNLDIGWGWAAKQLGAWQGWKSLNINVFRLVGEPEATEWSRHKPFLFLYATYWYMHISERTFWGSRILLYDYDGSAIYLAALAPTLLMLAGTVRAFAGRGIPAIPGRKLLGRACIAMLVLNLVLVVAAGFRYDVWSVFQGRLLYPSYGGAMIATGAGLDALRRWRGWLRLALYDLGLLCFLFIFYIAVEIVFYFYMKTVIIPGH